MMKQKRFLRGHPIIRCPKNTWQIDRGKPDAEARFQQSCCYAPLLKSQFQQSCCYAPLLKSHCDIGAPAPCRFAAYALKHS